MFGFLDSLPHARPVRLLSLAALVALLACDSITGSGDDPCFDADKTQSIDTDDVRIHISNFSETQLLTAAFDGPRGQTQVCNPVRTDPATPTNVVFLMDVGETVRITFDAPQTVGVSHVCVLSADAYGPAVGSPGNAFVSVFMGGTESSITCDGGFEPSAKTEVAP